MYYGPIYKRYYLVLFTALLCGSLAISGCATGSGSTRDSTARLDQSEAASSLRLARATRAAGDLASAINLYRNVVALKPKDAAVLVELGDTLTEAGSLDDAIGVYGRVSEDSPERLGALIGLSSVYLRLNEPSKALDDANLAGAIAPGDIRVLNRRGVALDKLLRHSEAQECYRAILVSKPRSVSARNNLALSLALTRQFGEAITILTPMARSSDASPQIRQNLAFIYGLKGDNENAAALSRMDLSPDKVQANLRFFDYARDRKLQ